MAGSRFEDRGRPRAYPPEYVQGAFMLGRKEEGLKLAHILKKEPNLGIANVAAPLSLPIAHKCRN